MGFIAEGSTLGWQDAAKQSRYVRDHGIVQLLNIYKKYKDRKNDKLSWGDEVCGVCLDVFWGRKCIIGRARVRKAMKHHTLQHER